MILKFRHLNLFWIVVSSLLMSACTTVGPDYVKPEVKTPAKFNTRVDETAFNTSSIKAHWWELYQDETLNQLMQRLNQRNLSLKSWTGVVKQARAVAMITKARKYPTIFAGGENVFGLLANWEVDLWGKIKRTIEASKADAQATLADFGSLKLSIQAQLAQNYFMLRIQDAEIKLLSETITSYQRSLQIAKNQYDVGIVNKGNVAQAQAQLSSTQTKWHDARINRAKLEHSIAVLVGEFPENFNLAVIDSIPEVPQLPAVLPSELLKRRPDIHAAERRIAAANAKIGVAKSESYPSFNLLAGIAIGKGLVGKSKVVSPIYTGGSLKGMRLQAKEAYVEAESNYRQTILLSFQEVEDNLTELKILKEAAKAQQQAVDASNKVVKISKDQYHSGIVNYQSVVIAQATDLADQRNALRILSRRLLASIALIKAMGGGWEVENPQIAEKQNSKP